ncbi:sensor domain-containing diguanylate cyclase [Thiobacillus sp.]
MPAPRQIDSYALLKELVTLTSPFICDEFFRKLTGAFGRTLGADWVFIARVLDMEKTQVRVLGAWRSGTNMDGWDFPLDGTPCSVVYGGENSDQSVVHVDRNSRVHISRDLCEIFPAAESSSFQSFLGLPLWARDGEMVGHVAAFFKEALTSQEEAEQLLEILQLLAYRAESELDRLLLEEEKKSALSALKEANERLRKESITDPLTGLYNRRFFFQRCIEAHAHSQRSGKPYAVLIIDIDKFKSINDEYGHDVGDNVLSKIAHRLAEQIRVNIDVIARIGGEEFGVLCRDSDASQALTGTGERLREVVANEPIQYRGLYLQVSISIGVAQGGPGSNGGWEDAYRRADKALYEAKSGGRNTVRLLN